MKTQASDGRMRRRLPRDATTRSSTPGHVATRPGTATADRLPTGRDRETFPVIRRPNLRMPRRSAETGVLGLVALAVVYVALVVPAELALLLVTWVVALVFGHALLFAIVGSVGRALTALEERSLGLEQARPTVVEPAAVDPDLDD